MTLVTVLSPNRMIKVLKIKHLKHNLLAFVCIFLLFISSFSGLLQAATPTPTPAADSGLSDKIKELNQQIEQIKKKKAQIESEITSESKNQSNLTSQISVYDKRIQTIQLTIQEKETYIKTLEEQISLTKEKIKLLEARISELQTSINQLNDIHAERIKSNFEKSFASPLDNILDGKNFEGYLVQREFSSSLAGENQKVVVDLTTTKAEVDKDKANIAKELATQNELYDQVKAETTDLAYQKEGLDNQKKQKAIFLEQSKVKTGQLKVQQDDLFKQLKELQEKMNAFLNQLLSTRSSGTAVKKGDIIGLSGRSGFVMDYNPTTKQFYYPDPDTEPCAAAHVHFMVSVATSPGANSYTVVNPAPYLEDKTIAWPFPSHSISQYYANNPGWGFHNGMDIKYPPQPCGSPIYAGADGIVSYGCSPFQYPGARRKDDAFYAKIYYPAKNMNILYYHMKKPAGMAGCPV